MMKPEFEELIGKEVDNEVFELYNNLYMALPETVDKKSFVKMLNISVIPESHDAVERKQRNHDFVVKFALSRVSDLINEIKELKTLTFEKKDEERCRQKLITYKSNRIAEINLLCGTAFKVM